MAAQLASVQAVTEGTSQKQARYWGYYVNYLQQIELDGDPFLDEFVRFDRQRVLGAFAAAVRRNGVQTYANASKASPPVSGTIRATIDAVSQAFKQHKRPSPIHDEDTGKLAFILQRQLKGYTNADGSVRHQKAITPHLLREVSKMALTESDQVASELSRGAFFFAMHSCEYLKVLGTERCTKLLTIANIRFYHDRQEMPHDHPELHLADCVNITIAPTTRCSAQFAAGRTAIVRHILSYPGTGLTTPVNVYQDASGDLCSLSSKRVLLNLRAAARAIGRDHLGFGEMDIGTHSIHSGAAMAMYLAAVPVFTIMLIGRWSSDAFLRYIRRQVQEFSSEVSSKMILAPDYFTIPDAGHEDPRTPAARLNNGLDAQRQAQQGAFALHH
eukprot:scaffold39906_cov57-Attheya_sp.AAC.8